MRIKLLGLLGIIILVSAVIFLIVMEAATQAPGCDLYREMSPVCFAPGNPLTPLAEQMGAWWGYQSLPLIIFMIAIVGILAGGGLLYGVAARTPRWYEG